MKALVADDSSLKYRRIRAPKNHGEVLHLPESSNWPDTWNANLKLNFDGAAFHSNSLADLRHSGRQEIAAAALKFTRQYRDVELDDRDGSKIVMSGHQPSLFHPGVWYKNFVLDHLGQRFQCLPINLIVDNDVATTAHVNVPILDNNNAFLKPVRFDESGVATPFEHRQIINEQQFKAFSHSITQSISPMVANPIIGKLWPYVLQNNDSNLGLAIAKGRHRLEQDFGLQTLELPLSSLAETNAFTAFAWETISRHRDLQLIYNSTIQTYREIHKIKNQAQPLPELTQNDDWFETPFWVWTVDKPIRRSLFVRNHSDQLELSDLENLRATVSSNATAQQFGEQVRRHFCLRPKALMTTMFSRLIASDLFIHGIGGSKYDQLTDEIALQFFKTQLPDYLTISGTFMIQHQILPITKNQLSATRDEIRQLYFHPEKFLQESDPQSDRWAQQKKEWINQELPRGQRLVRHQAIVEANQHLHAQVADTKSKRHSELQQLTDQFPVSKVLNSREFSFCLYSEDLIHELSQLTHST